MKLLWFFCLLFPQIAQAQLFVTKNTTGASSLLIDKNKNVTIFGGTAFNHSDSGSECVTQNDDDSDGGNSFGELLNTCNSCTASLQSCNANRISDNLLLGIAFYVNSAPAPGPILVTTEHGVEIEQSAFRENTNAFVEPNQLTKVYIDWTELCAISGTGFCNESPGIILIKVGIDSNEDGKINNQEGGFVTIKIQNPNKDQEANLSSIDCSKAGVCDFKVFSGNEKVFIGHIKSSSQFPNWKGSVFNTLKVFYSSEGFQKVTPLSNNVEVSISTTVEEESIIGPLKNNIQYYFRVAVMDEAKNIAFITSDEQIQKACGGTGQLTASQCDSCPYCTKPSGVVGILSKDLNCFITTATYGSNQAMLVKLFREFRNAVLLKFKSGIWLTKQYYKWGSQGSLVLQKYPVLKIFTGLLLTPLAVLAWISLHLSYFLFFIGIFLLLIIATRFFKRRQTSSILSLLLFTCFFTQGLQKVKAQTATYEKKNNYLKLSSQYPSAKYEFYSFQIGPFTPLKLRGDKASYSDVYGSSKHFMLLLSYEKNISSSFGLLSFDIGSGFMATTAPGLKENTRSERSHEKLLFLLIPNHASLIYRFQYSSNPVISPYIKGGITAFGIVESPQSSGAKIKLALAPASHIAAGLGINMMNWSSSKKELKNDYNMHSFFIFAEYKVYKSLSKKFDLSNNMISAGLTLGF
ncbi:MAG: hypothetical protein HAW63_01680 [Bdellovibrionaceae bacterium]|nr:hypothetical protein [Pseudobdellovibrionaceae bacterium]